MQTRRQRAARCSLAWWLRTQEEPEDFSITQYIKPELDVYYWGDMRSEKEGTKFPVGEEGEEGRIHLR